MKKPLATTDHFLVLMSLLDNDCCFTYSGVALDLPGEKAYSSLSKLSEGTNSSSPSFVMGDALTFSSSKSLLSSSSSASSSSSSEKSKVYLGLSAKRKNRNECKGTCCYSSK